MLTATYLRTRVRFLQKFLIPNAITAGFLLLPLYNYGAPLFIISSDNLGELVYHLMSISFIAITLRPGQVFAIGGRWEAFGFYGAGSVGLTFAAIGFLCASFGGVFMVNYGYRNGWAGRDTARAAARPDHRKGFYPRGGDRPVGSKLTSVSEAIDTMSLNIGMVFSTYLLSYVGLLLRMSDPDFETPVASDYVFTSAVVFVLIIPLILIHYVQPANLPPGKASHLSCGRGESESMQMKCELSVGVP